MRVAGGLLGLAAAALLAACEPEVSLEADPQPIPLDLISGVPITVAVIPGREPFHLLVDTASPLSAIDPHGASPGVETLDELRLMRPDDTRVVRAVIHNLEVVKTPLFQAGTTTPVAIAGVLGGNVLAHYAVRFSYSADGATMVFTERDYDQGKPESDDDLARAGRVVVKSYVLGGGSYELGDTTASYGATRLTVPACALVGGRAVDMTLLIATGYGPLVLGRAAAARILDHAVPQAEVDRLYVPGVQGGVPVLERGVLLAAPPAGFAIVGDEHGTGSQPSTDLGGPCTQLFRHQTLQGFTGSADCPAPAEVAPAAGDVRVGAAYVEICANAPPLEYVVIDDQEPLLASVRAELRPHVPEIDGFAGTEVLKHFVTELNYTNNRVIFTCAESGVGCFSRPRTGYPAQ